MLLIYLLLFEIFYLPLVVDHQVQHSQPIRPYVSPLLTIQLIVQMVLRQLNHEPFLSPEQQVVVCTMLDVGLLDLEFAYSGNKNFLLVFRYFCVKVFINKFFSI